MSEPKHLCLTCTHASTEVPSEVLVEVAVGETVNIADELKRVQTDMAKYKYVHYCPQLKAIVVGGDSLAQMRKDCDRHATRA